MKEMWNTWRALKAKTSLGWDPDKNCITGKVHTWQEFVKVSIVIFLFLWFTIVLPIKFN